MGDTQRFTTFRERIGLLFDAQARNWTGTTGEWLVIPLDRTPQGFYLLSMDREGQRRGREVLNAFLGPTTANLDTTPLAPRVQQVDRDLETVGFVHLSHVCRTEDDAQLRLIQRLEDAIATINAKDARPRPIRLSYLSLLRDFRLALQQQDARQAESAFTALRLTGQLSAENIRFLKIEMLGRLGRWSELRSLQHLGDLLKARRPRAINELLFEMIWRTEVSDLDSKGLTPNDIYTEAELGSRYGTLVNSIEVPATESGRAIGAIAAVALSDTGRLDRIINAARSDAERARLQRMTGPVPILAPSTPGIAELYEQGQYSAVTRMFLEAPTPEGVDIAVQAVLDCEERAHAGRISAIIEEFVAQGLVRVTRRLHRDLRELSDLASSTCAGWAQWFQRIARDEPWPEAAKTLRALHTEWPDFATLTPEQLKETADDVMLAWDGINQAQVVAALDLLCHAAAATTHVGDLCEAVLLILSDQDNLSAPVRDAYLDLFDQLLEHGTSSDRYRISVDHAVSLWQNIAAPTTVDWGIAVVDTLLLRPVAEPSARIGAVSAILAKARDFDHRLNRRQRTEIEVLSGEAGLPTRPTPAATTSMDIVWNKLNGAVIGLYSLLPHAADALARRLVPLCSPKAVEGNDDTVSTLALKNLATKSDHMIVDTSHATHAATSAIDAVRPRDQQILPRGRGVSAFVQALERSLTSVDA